LHLNCSMGSTLSVRLLLSSSALCIVICSSTWSFVYGDIDIEWFLSLHWSYKLWYDNGDLHPYVLSFWMEGSSPFALHTW
jgi:hypothetical protein